jgi:hypothetical protein
MIDVPKSGGYWEVVDITEHKVTLLLTHIQ